MLPLWRDRLFIALRPDAVALARCPPWGAELREQAVARCANEESTFEWKSALRTLATQLAVPRWHGASATIVLSHHFVRYAALPWADNVRTHEERVAVARLHFEKIFGERAAHWNIRVSRGRMGAPWLTSAVDAALVPELRTICDQAGVILISTQPYLMAAANACRGELRRKRVCFAVAERGRLLLSMLNNGGWMAVRALPLGASLGIELAHQLEREEALTGTASASGIVHLYAPEHGEIQWPAGTRWTLKVLNSLRTGRAPLEGPLAMAMTGNY